MDLGTYIKDLIQEKGRSIKSLSERMLIDRGTFYQVLRNGRMPTAVFIERLSLCLDLEPEEEYELLRQVYRMKIGEAEFAQMEKLINFIQRLNGVDWRTEERESRFPGAHELPLQATAASGAAADRLMTDFFLSSLSSADITAFLPGEGSPDMFGMLDEYRSNKRVEIRHLFIRQQEPLALLDPLSSILRATFDENIQYDPMYSTTQKAFEGTPYFRSFAFPYYMLFDDEVLLRSTKGDEAFYMHSQAMAEQLRRIFAAAGERSRNLFVRLSTPEDTIEHVKKQKENGLGASYDRLLSRLPLDALLSQDCEIDDSFASACAKRVEDVFGNGILLLDVDALNAFIGNGECFFWGETIRFPEIGVRLALLKRLKDYANTHPLFFLRGERLRHRGQIEIYAGDAEVIFSAARANGASAGSRVLRDPDIVSLCKRFFVHISRSEMVIGPNDAQRLIERCCDNLSAGVAEPVSIT